MNLEKKLSKLLGILNDIIKDIPNLRFSILNLCDLSIVILRYKDNTIGKITVSESGIILHSRANNNSHITNILFYIHASLNNRYKKLKKINKIKKGDG